MLGPGKYDDVARVALNQTAADAVVMIAVGGKDGSGCSVLTDPETARELPGILRALADQIEADVTRLGQRGPAS